MVALACSPEIGQRWWDVCCGGGGKTLHLATLMQGRGEVWATDIRESALAELHRRVKKTRLKNITTQLLEQGPSDFALMSSSNDDENKLFIF